MSLPRFHSHFHAYSLSSNEIRFDAYKHLEFKKLSMGRLLGDLKASIESKLADPKEKENKLRLALYACHDTSLGGIL